MTLKTDFYDGPNGFNEQMNDVFDQGVALITASLAQLTLDLQAEAAKGNKEFTVTIATAFEPANLRLEGLHWKTYRSGILNELANQDIFLYEVDVELNTSDNSTTSVDLLFTF